MYVSDSSELRPVLLLLLLLSDVQKIKKIKKNQSLTLGYWCGSSGNGVKFQLF